MSGCVLRVSVPRFDVDAVALRLRMPGKDVFRRGEPRGHPRDHGWIGTSQNVRAASPFAPLRRVS